MKISFSMAIAAVQRKSIGTEIIVIQLLNVTICRLFTKVYFNPIDMRRSVCYTTSISNCVLRASLFVYKVKKPFNLLQMHKSTFDS